MRKLIPNIILYAILWGKNKLERKWLFFKHHLRKMEKSIYKLISCELSKYKLIIFFMFTLTVTGAILTSLVPNVVGEIIDVALVEKNIQHLGYFVICLIVFLTIGNICVAARQYLSAIVTANLDISLTKKVFKNIIDAKYSFFMENQNGDILQRITKDVKSLQDFKIDTILGFGYDVVLALFSFAAILSIYWPLAVVGLAVYGIYFLPTRYMGKLLKKYSNILRNQSAKLKEMVIERTKDIGQIKIYGTEEEEYAQICIEQENWGRSLQKKYVVDQSGRAFPRILGALIPTIVFVAGGYQFFIGNLSIGNLLAITVYLPYLNKPIKSFTSFFFQIKDISARMNKVGEYLKLPPEEENKEETDSSFCLAGKIEFRDVSVINERGVILDRVSFVVNPGEHVALVGTTGSGKSTILKLIIRLIEPTSGEIFIDDKPLQTISAFEIRKRVGNILQDTFVFSDSIEKNLKYLNPLATDSEIEKLVEEMDLKKVIANLPNGYQTHMGENGTNFSGGQRQRLGIVRALLRPTDILLMDEATSALDIDSEMKVHKTTMSRMDKKTCIYTAHRLETVVDADDIIVLKAGKIVEKGTHEILYNKDGYYHDLWKENIGTRKSEI